MKLTIELVPSTCWFTNVRSQVTRECWDKIRKAVYAQASSKCEICGGEGTKHPVECHEVWHFDDANHAQLLVGMIALCPSCHMVKHLGFAQHRGEGGAALNHLAVVNNIPFNDALDYAAECFNIWEERSKHEWTLDITWLDKSGYQYCGKGQRRPRGDNEELNDYWKNEQSHD